MKNLDVFNFSSIEPRVEVARENGVDFSVGQFANTLDDTLSNPGIFIRDCTSVSVDFEDNTDSKSIFARD